MSKHSSPTPISRILIVDDDIMMRELMKEALINDEYIIDEVDNGLDALQAVNENEPDMMLLDVKMPGMNGFDVCSEIRKQFGMERISIVMVTGLEDSESIEKAFSLGATAFINKPINSITFRYQIQYLLKARNAFVELKQRETHLEYMERISRILAQSKKRDLILHEALTEMLDIFSADRVFIISSLDSESAGLEVSYEAVRDGRLAIMGNESAFIAEMELGLLHRAEYSEFPLITSSAENTETLEHTAIEISNKFQVHNQMLKSLRLRDDQTWFLVIHQCSDSQTWSTLEQETFYRISIRLGNLLSRYLLMESLRRSEYLLRHAQRIGHLGNWSLNVKTDQLSWSDEIYRIYGYEPGSFKPEREAFFKIVFEEDNARLEQFEHTIFMSSRTYSIEHRIKLPNGEVRWVHEQGVGEFDEYGYLIEVNGTVQDITDRIRNKEQEVHDQKMDAVGQLTSGIAHDFGNLMTIAKGNLELLDEAFTEQYHIDRENMDILNDARSAIHDGVELTRQLLASSRRKSIAPEYLNIRETISNFSKIFKNTLGDQIELSVHIENNLPDILVDSAQFESSLLNVIINARDAMPDGGILSINAEVKNDQTGSHSHNHGNGNTGKYVCITLEDSGTGMTGETLKHATEPFFTTKKNEGTGLGLSMVYGFMRQSKGELIIDSTPGKGTRITIQFPVYGGKEHSQTRMADNDIRPFNGETVLVVEDRPAVRRYAVRCLEKLNLTILEASNASLAKQLLDEHHTVDLLFTDILMPGEMNGRELAAWASEKLPALKILLTTASEKEARRRQPSNMQTFPVLPKPYSKNDLIKKIHELI